MMDLLTLLQLHKGRNRAITAKDISKIVNMDERLVRSKIRGLIADGWPIASATEKPAGYFIISTTDEADAYKKSLRDRLIEDALRLRDFKRAEARHFDSGNQGRLFE